MRDAVPFAEEIAERMTVAGPRLCDCKARVDRGEVERLPLLGIGEPPRRERGEDAVDDLRPLQRVEVGHRVGEFVEIAFDAV